MGRPERHRRTRNPPTCPSTGPRARLRSAIFASSAKCSAGLLLGGRDAHEPRHGLVPAPGIPPRKPSASAGRTPAFLRLFRRCSPARRGRDRPRSRPPAARAWRPVFGRSTEWITSKRLHRLPALLVCSGPSRCSSTPLVPGHPARPFPLPPPAPGSRRKSGVPPRARRSPVRGAGASIPRSAGPFRGGVRRRFRRPPDGP